MQSFHCRIHRDTDTHQSQSSVAVNSLAPSAFTATLEIPLDLSVYLLKLDMVGMVGPIVAGKSTWAAP